MPYKFPNDIPRWAEKKSDAVQKVAIDVFNQTLKDTGSEQKAMAASMKAMSNAEESFKKYAVKKAVIDGIKAKLFPENS